MGQSITKDVNIVELPFAANGSLHTCITKLGFSNYFHSLEIGSK